MENFLRQPVTEVLIAWSRAQVAERQDQYGEIGGGPRCSAFERNELGNVSALGISMRSASARDSKQVAAADCDSEQRGVAGHCRGEEVAELEECQHIGAPGGTTQQHQAEIVVGAEPRLGWRSMAMWQRKVHFKPAYSVSKF